VIEKCLSLHLPLLSVRAKSGKGASLAALSFLPQVEPGGIQKGIYHEFVLDGGQRVAYPVSWTVSKENAGQAYSYFLRTSEKAPWLAWHDNSQE